MPTNSGLEYISPIDRVIARRLEIAREDAGLIKMDVAEKLGITKQGYTPYERGEHAFTVAEVLKLSQIMGRPVEWFLDLKCTDLSEDDQRMLAPFRTIKNKTLRQFAIDQMRAIAGMPHHAVNGETDNPRPEVENGSAGEG